MPQFRKKPVVIEAVQWDGAAMAPPLPEWFAGAWCDRTIDRDQQDRTKLNIQTLEGVMQAAAGDWIIRGVKGELYPCKPDIFAATVTPMATMSRDTSEFGSAAHSDAGAPPVSR